MGGPRWKQEGDLGSNPLKRQRFSVPDATVKNCEGKANPEAILKLDPRRLLTN